MAGIVRSLFGRKPYEPLPRYGHYSVPINGKLHVWGGRTQDWSESSRKKLASALETFDPYMELWKKQGTTGVPPPGLYGGACTAIGESMYSYGGLDGQSQYNTLHQLDTARQHWREVQVRNPSEGPMKKTGCGMISYDGDKLVLIGGHGIPTGPIQPGSTFIRSTGYTDGRGWTNELHLFHLGEGKGLLNNLWTSIFCGGISCRKLYTEKCHLHCCFGYR